METTPSRSGQLPINSLSLYLRGVWRARHVEAGPLLTVPGAFMATDSMKPWVSSSVSNRAVIIFDQHGPRRTVRWYARRGGVPGAHPGCQGVRGPRRKDEGSGQQ